MSNVEYVKVRQKPIKSVDKDLRADQSEQVYIFENKEYRLGRTEIKTVPRNVASAWASATTVVEILKDLGSY